MDYRWYEDSKRQPTWKKHFPVVGQGTVFFNIIRGTPFAIVVRPAEASPACSWQWIALEIYKNKAIFLLGKPDGKPQELSRTEKFGVGFDADEKTSYWLSFDRDRLVVKYGKGYSMDDTTLLEGAYYSAERNGTEHLIPQNTYVICGTHQNGPKTASQLSSYYIDMYPKQVALIS